MPVPATLAEWLRSPELVDVVESAAVLAAWDDLAADSPVSSPLALRDDATEEGARQIAFLGFPLAAEALELPGRHANLVGLSRRIQAEEEGYRDAPSVFVIGAEERPGGTTLLTVLRRVQSA